MNLKKMTSMLGITVACSGVLLSAGSTFAATATDTHQETPVKATVTVGKLPDKPSLPTLPGGGGGNDNTNNNNTNQNTTTTKVSIAYQPVAFTGTGSVQASGAAAINLKVTDAQGGNESQTGHVGVKDQTKGKNNWKLNASFNPVSNELKNNSNITLENGTVKVSNDGLGGLNALTNGEVTAVASPTLTTTPTPIMSAVSSKVQYGVYDYGFSNIKLNVTDSSSLVSGTTYTGTVNWDLQDVPSPNTF